MTKLRDKMKEEMALRHFAPGTQSQYLRAVIKLAVYYNKSPAKLSEQELRAFLLFMAKQEHCSASTYNVMLHGLKFFYRTVLGNKILAFEFPCMREAQRLPDILSQEEVTLIIKATRNIKHRTLLILIYGAGLRASEAGSLRARDIDRDRRCIHIREGKGRKDRYVPLSPVMLNALQDYWKACRVREAKTDNPLIFPGDQGSALSASSVGAIYTRSKKQVGIQKQGGVHALRHAFATHSLEAGADLYAINKILGHAAMSSTVRYLRMTDKTLQMVESPVERLNL